ncbi:hypothetical protein BCR35DRAFT_302990 [Leucosporidium creatinivorum]|uniref:Uncharacterized protein n=1 Tax=Leucosporidium creatinivorum TaxID=106004 RepID=A0A1Y2FPM9_9BASI|nr:hypothetical protein BCR35DRAFT_302990 [Leucosporidium creatinivorum]
MFASTTSNTLPASHAGAHDYDPRQEGSFTHTERDRTSAAVEGAGHKSRGTHTATPESRGSTHTPTRGRSLDQNKQQQNTEGAGPSLVLPLSQSPSESQSSLNLSHGTSDPSAGIPYNLSHGAHSNESTKEMRAPREVADEVDPMRTAEPAPATDHPSKPSISSKIAGRVDVLVGKATHNEGKILEGNMKQRGEVTSQAD